MNWKHIVRYPFDIRIAEQQLTSPGKSASADDAGQGAASVIGIDLYTDQLLFDCGRHLSCLAAHARRIGSDVVLRCNRVLLAAIAHKPHGRVFLGMPNVRWVPPHDRFPEQSLVLLDVDGTQAARDLAGCRSDAMLIGRQPVEKTMVMPYPMHPNQILKLDQSESDSLRSAPKAGIFFAGSQKRRYGRDAMTQRFGVMSRLDVLSSLRRQFSDRIEAREAAGRDDRIVLRDSASDPVDAKDWMSVLASHQFFICCPGASQPICHNVVEAMAVGVIPILEYSDRFTPELIDGQNAICFHGPKGLAAAVRRIDTMAPEKRRRLSENVCDYYDAHLDGSRFLKRLRDELNTDFVDQISMPFHDQDLFSVETPPSGHVRTEKTRPESGRSRAA